MSKRGPPYTCTQCDKTYSVYSSFKSHLLLKHTKPDKKCSFCATYFHTQTTLNAHMYKCMQATPSNYQNECVVENIPAKQQNNLRITMFSDDISSL